MSEHNSWCLFFVGESDFQWTWWHELQMKRPSLSIKVHRANALSGFETILSWEGWQVIATCWSTWWWWLWPKVGHMESCLDQAGVDTSPSSLDCSVGKKFMVDDRHPQVSTGWFLDWMDYLPGKRREPFQPQPWRQHPGSRTAPCTRLQVWSPPVNGKTYLM